MKGNFLKNLICLTNKDKYFEKQYIKEEAQNSIFNNMLLLKRDFI